MIEWYIDKYGIEGYTLDGVLIYHWVSNRNKLVVYSETDINKSKEIAAFKITNNKQKRK